MQYICTFTGYLNDLFRPRDFPKTVSDYVVLTANTNKELQDQVAVYFAYFAKLGGMMLHKNSSRHIDPTKINADRMLIPTIMFSSIQSKVLPLLGEVPEVNADGETVVPSGKKVWKN